MGESIIYSGLFFRSSSLVSSASYSLFRAPPFVSVGIRGELSSTTKKKKKKTIIILMTHDLDSKKALTLRQWSSVAGKMAVTRS